MGFLYKILLNGAKHPYNPMSWVITHITPWVDFQRYNWYQPVGMAPLEKRFSDADPSVPPKWYMDYMLGNENSSWDGLFSGAMLVWEKVFHSLILNSNQTSCLKKSWQTTKNFQNPNVSGIWGHTLPPNADETCKESSAQFFVCASFHCASRSTHRDFPAPAVFGAKPTGRVVKMDFFFPRFFGHGFRCQQPQNFPGVAKKIFGSVVVEPTPLKNICPNGNLSQTGVKIKIFETTTW